MANLFKNLKPEAHLSKNGFDLSRRHIFSSPIGLCLPALAVETVPNDYMEIDLISLTRTQTFNTAAFIRGKQKYDFYFVPFTQLWSPFNQFISQRNDPVSTRQLNHSFCPVVELKDVIMFLYLQYNGMQDVDYLDYSNRPFVQGAIRLLDLLGYGDFRWIMDQKYDEDTSDFEGKLAIAYAGKYVNIFRLAAYQKIMYDYYRNKYWDVDDTGGQSPLYGNMIGYNIYHWNFDDVNCNSFANSVLYPSADERRMAGLLMPRYAPWKKDLFTGLLPGQQFGVVSSVNAILPIVGRYPDADDVQTVYASYNSQYTYQGLSFDSSSDPVDVNVPFDVLSLKKAEYLQAWKQSTLRAGNDTDDQFRAHYGVEPYYEPVKQCHYLGSFSASLNINDVAATAATDSASNPNNYDVGDLAGNGSVFVRGNKIEFRARDFGIIMCISSFVPENDYASGGLDKANMLHEQFDFFTPEFQNIGLEPVLQIEQSQNKYVDWYAPLGFAPRYYHYKTAIDKVFGDFHDSSFTLQGVADKASIQGTLRPWVALRGDDAQANVNGRPIDNFYVNPKMFNDVLGISYSGKQSEDYLLHSVYFDIKAIRPMSVLGLPQF